MGPYRKNNMAYISEIYAIYRNDFWEHFRATGSLVIFGTLPFVVIFFGVVPALCSWCAGVSLLHFIVAIGRLVSHNRFMDRIFPK